MKDSGVAQREIARKLGVTEQAVSNAIRRHSSKSPIELRDFYKRAIKPKKDTLLGFPLRFFYENMLALSSGKMPKIDWTNNFLKDKYVYSQVISKLERQGKLIVLFYLSSEWKKVRISIFLRDQHTCRLCGIRHSKMDVHHINSAIYNPELCLYEKNLLLVCKNCHQEISRD